MPNHRSRPVALLLTIGSIIGAPAGAGAAGPPTMPLSAVQPGMACTARTVLRGTEISTFDVRVIDVGDRGTDKRIIVRASGPGVDDTGVAQGYSGSPVYCPTGDGGTAIAGAISEGTGDYGNTLVLVTPIEEMLAEPITAVAQGASARSLAGALTLTGPTGPVAAALQRAARKAGRQLIVAPGTNRALTLAPAALEPGSAVAAGVSVGAITAGAVGTVTYVDGDRIWAFGHPLDNGGRRSLLLQSAYVYAVVGSPLSIEGATPFKLAAPIAAIGTLTDDRPSGISGVLGALPRTFPLKIATRNADTGALRVEETEITDERSLGQPGGGNPLELIAPVGVSQAALDALRGSPSQMTGRMCMKIRVVGRSEPFAFCNHYAGAALESPGGAMPSDAGAAVSAVSTYARTPLKITGVDVDMRISQRPPIATITSVSIRPAAPRPGQRATVRVLAKIADTGERIERTHQVRVPRSARPGRRLVLRVEGSDPDTGPGSSLSSAMDVPFGDGEDQEDAPQSLSELADRIKGLERDDRARISLGGGRWRLPLAVPEDLRLSGSASRSVRIARG